MSQRAFAKEFEDYPEWTTAVQNMITEDDEPLVNSFVEKQMRLLVSSLYASWQLAPFEDAPNEKRSFWAAANVGVFASPFFPPIVPDVFLSLDVSAPEGDFNEKENRSYCLWKHEGKAPDVVVELISDKRGGEFDEKMESYGRMKVDYYITFDPLERREEPFLRVYERSFAWRYRLRDDLSLPNIGLNLVLWQGEYEGMNATWLRWRDVSGNLILTGTERADVEAEARRRAEAEIEQLKAELARLRGEN